MTIDIYRDPWGIPHLRASSTSALAFAQGHNAATDRAFQIEVDRHRSQGSSAAFLGADELAWDVFARKSRLDDTAQRCFHRLDADTRAWVCAYVDGVNAGLREGAARAPEFAASGLTPGQWRPWTPLGVWLSTHILFAGFPTKLWRDEVARRFGDAAIHLFASDGPAIAGSNGWLVTGNRTITGAPILAGDPHRFIEDPGVYQQIHLSCPEYDVVGLAVPGVPGIAHFAHTGTVAWAITNAMADYQDLYRERLRRCGDEVEALGPHGYRPASRHVETIEVAGKAPIEVEVIETERGPVVIGGPDDTDAISLRYPPRVREDLGFAALPALLRATTVADVDRALDAWVEPVNVVQAADIRGGLLHRAAGVVPVRHRDNSLRVVAAWEPEHEWQGWHEPLPREAVDGVAVMANQRGVSAPLGVEFAPPHRARRIRQLLDASSVWSAKDMATIHTDTHLASARTLLNALARVNGLGPNAERLRARLLDWDLHMAADSAEAAAYAAVRAAVVRRFSADPELATLAELIEGGTYPELFWPWLALVPRVAFALERLLTTDQLARVDRAEIVRAALEEVAATEDSERPWSELHRLAPWRALPAARDEAWPGLPGDHDCVLSTYSIPGVTHHSARGPVARYVWDLARREDSLWVVPFGASGVAGDDHHEDQLPLWLRGELVPVITSWHRLTLARNLDSARRSAVHEQAVRGFGTVRIVPVDPPRDIDLIYSWVREERARFWGMREHSREYVLEIYEYLESLTTHHAYLVYRDDDPVALFQTYEPAFDPVGERYDVQPGDFGIHLLVGPTVGDSQPGFTGSLLSALIDYVLTAPSVQRIVVDPDARNHKAIARFTRTGFVLGEEIQLPEKRARLAFLTRDAARQSRF